MKSVGIYIHIPFCRSRCSYCDFATGMYDVNAAERYVRAVVREIELSPQPQHSVVDTIYFGGGTPSLLNATQLEILLKAVRDRFHLAPEIEVTLEMNPGTVDRERARDCRRLGVNRASFGAQTFDDNELARLGRSHSVADTRQTFQHLRDAGFDNVSFDLIAGLPGQSIEAWNRNLDEAFALRPEHLSFYLLEVHQGTPLAEHIRRGIQPSPDEDVATEMYAAMLERAGSEGYEHYEISNLCLPGFESRHNSKYWTGAPYFGFGCSAHSYDGDTRRWANERDIKTYLNMIETGQSPVIDQRELTKQDQRAEAVFLGLRMMSGIDARQHRKLFDCDLKERFADELTRFSEAGLIDFDGEVLKLTRSGALLSNEVFAAFV